MLPARPTMSLEAGASSERIVLMTTSSSRIVADVKCYFCGHVSGQIVGYRNGPLSLSNFVPRPGASGSSVSSGGRLRCKRCGGPVFLEEATSRAIGEPAIETQLATRRSAGQRDKAA